MSFIRDCLCVHQRHLFQQSLCLHQSLFVQQHCCLARGLRRYQFVWVKG